MYVKQEYPKKMYNSSGGKVRVLNLEEESKLGDGWADSPAGPFTRPRGRPKKEVKADADSPDDNQ